MKTLFCKKCSKDVTFIIEKKVNNNVAYCTVCGCYIKNVPNHFLEIKTENHIFPFGKYKGVKISECLDKDYLLWAFNNLDKMSDSFLDAIFDRLTELYSK